MTGVPEWYPGDPPWFEPPKLLFHYTTAEGLRGIIESGGLRATDAHFLNDAQEIHHALGHFEKTIPELLDQIGEGSEQIVRLWEGALDRLLTFDVFVFCLSTSYDDLSQWRAYSDGTGGYAIGFDGPTLSRIANRQGFILTQCLYSGPDYTESLRGKDDELHPVEDFVEAVLWEILLELRDVVREKRDEESTVNKTVVTLSHLAPRLKHFAFSDEMEWRLISTPGFADYSERASTRDGGVMPIPFYEVDLQLERETASPIVHSVVIGPTSDPELSASAVKKLFRYAGIPEPLIEHTDVPYREV